MKYCNHCNTEHPLTTEYWYKNNGVLRKCKRYYTLYEYKRACLSKLNFKFRKRRDGHDALCQTLYKYIRKKLKLNAFYEVVMCDGLRADIVIPNLLIIIEVKSDRTSPSAAHAHKLKYNRLFPMYNVEIVSRNGRCGSTPKKLISKLRELQKNFK